MICTVANAYINNNVDGGGSGISRKSDKLTFCIFNRARIVSSRLSCRAPAFFETEICNWFNAITVAKCLQAGKVRKTFHPVPKDGENAPCGPSV